MNRMTRMDAVFTFGTTGTTTTDYTCAESGFVKIVAVKVPNHTSVATATITVKDQDGNTLWTKGTIAKNATTKYGADIETAETGVIPVDHGYKISCVLSADAGASGSTIHAYLYTEV